MRKWFNGLFDYLKEGYAELESIYDRFRHFFTILVISAIVFHAIYWLDYQRNFFFNQEVFDLNNIPNGKVIWVYPKNKHQSPILPDSLKKEFKITDDPTSEPDLNYNIDAWVVAIYTDRNQIVKIEVPDYAIHQFILGQRFEHGEGFLDSKH